MSTGDRGLFLLVTGLGSGLAPVAPGTFGTLVGVVIGAVLQIWLVSPALAYVLGGAGLLLLAMGCMTTSFVERTFQNKDPGPFVLDEIVGYLFALGIYAAMLEEGEGPSPMAHALCFFFFRVLDVIKPPPARQLEELKGAVGIMLDDVAAGVYAGLVLLALHYTGLLI